MWENVTIYNEWAAAVWFSVPFCVFEILPIRSSTLHVIRQMKNAYVHGVRSLSTIISSLGDQVKVRVGRPLSLSCLGPFAQFSTQPPWFCPLWLHHTSTLRTWALTLVCNTSTDFPDTQESPPSLILYLSLLIFNKRTHRIHHRISGLCDIFEIVFSFSGRMDSWSKSSIPPHSSQKAEGESSYRASDLHQETCSCQQNTSHPNERHVPPDALTVRACPLPLLLSTVGITCPRSPGLRMKKLCEADLTQHTSAWQTHRWPPRPWVRNIDNWDLGMFVILHYQSSNWLIQSWY